MSSNPIFRFSCVAFVLILLENSFVAEPPYFVWSYTQEEWVPSQTTNGAYHYFSFDRTEVGVLDMSDVYTQNGVDMAWSANTTSSSFTLADPQSLSITITAEDGAEIPCLPALSVTSKTSREFEFRDFMGDPGISAACMSLSANGTVGRTATHQGMLIFNDIEPFDSFDAWPMLISYYDEWYIG